MAKKKPTKTKARQAGAKPVETNVPVSRETAGAVTGAVLGGVVGGPVGALAGGAVGALVGDSSAKGKKPIKRAVDAIRAEITSGRAKAALKSVGKRIKSLGKSKSKKKVATKKSAAASSGVKKKKKAKVAKGVTGRKKKRVKKKG